jgi:hypothetical protein
MLNFIWLYARLKKTNDEGSHSTISNSLGHRYRMRFLVPGVHVYRVDRSNYHRDGLDVNTNLFIHKLQNRMNLVLSENKKPRFKNRGFCCGPIKTNGSNLVDLMTKINNII